MKFVVSAEWLSRMLASVAICASRDTTRPHLNAILIDVADGACVATDGHRLAVHEIAENAIDALTLDGPEAGSMLVALDDVDRIVKLLGKRPSGGVQVSAPAGEGSIAFSYQGTTMGVRRVEAAFPPWRQVMPPATMQADMTYGIAVNASYLADCGKAYAIAKGGKDRTGGIALHFGSYLDPVRVTCDDYPALTFVVMPMRRYAANEAPRAYVAPRYCESDPDRFARLRAEEEKRAAEIAAVLASFGAAPPIADAAE